MNKSIIIFILFFVILKITSISFNILVSMISNQQSILLNPFEFTYAISTLFIVTIGYLMFGKLKSNVLNKIIDINRLLKSILNNNNTNNCDIINNSSNNTISINNSIQTNSTNTNNSNSNINNRNGTDNINISNDCLNLINKYNQDLNSDILAIPLVNIDEIEFVNTLLGSGVNGVVKSAKYMGVDVAIKTGFEVDNFTINEIKCNSLLAGHKNIIDIKGCIEKKGVPSLILELMDVNLLDYLMYHKRALSGQQHSFYRMIYEIIDGLKYMHHNGFVHCDLHPGNILINKVVTNELGEYGPTQVKISDFGLCKYLPNDTVSDSSKIGSKLFMSPEAIAGGRSSYEKSDDIYSLGVLVWLMFGILAYGGNCDLFIKKFIIYGVSGMDIKVIPDLKELIGSCIGPRNQRPTIEEFEDEIKRIEAEVYNREEMYRNFNRNKFIY